jgi:peptidoglycan/LPS O-acetylase OafA/YrhL
MGIQSAMSEDVAQPELHSAAVPQSAAVPVSARKLGHSPVLDGLRGIAIVLVMLTHTSVLPNGYVGVDLFFALSGFLITTLLYEEWDRAGTISLRRFYRRRARRLLPGLGVLLVIALTVDLAIYPMTGWSFGLKALTSTLFVNNWVAATGHAKDLGSLNPTWSLAQEEQFYLVWPLLLVLMLRRRMRPQLVAVLLVAMIIALVLLSPHSHSYQVYYSPFTRAAELLFGCLGAVVWRHRLASPPRDRIESLGQELSARGVRLPSWAAGWAGSLGLGRGVGFWGSAGSWRSFVACVLAYMFARLLFNYQLTTEQIYLRACLIAVPLIMTLLSAPASLIARLIGVAPLRYLGRISYSLYLFHLLTRNVVYHYRPHGSNDLNALLTFAVSIALATVSWKLLESRVLAHGVDRRASADSRPSASPRPVAKPAILA